MRVDLSKEQEFLRKSVVGVLKRQATFAQVREWADARDGDSAHELAVDQGWTGIGVPEELDGQGGGLIELAVLAQELGATATPWDRLLGLILALRALAVTDPGPARELIAAGAEGEHPLTLCVDGRRIPAPWPGSILRDGALTLKAEYVPGARGADLVVPVQAAGEIELWLVSGAQADVAPAPLIDHTRALDTVTLDGVDAESLGRIDLAQFARVRDTAAVLVAADALGAARTLLEMTVAYVGQREQFGVPVGSFQAVKHAAAMMLVDVEAARSAVLYAAWAVDDGDEDAHSWSAIAQVQACGSAPHVADKALFLHGAIGYTWDSDLQFCFKRTKSDNLLYGDPDAYRDRIADDLALLPIG